MPFVTKNFLPRTRFIGVGMAGAHPVTSALQSSWNPTAEGSIAERILLSSGSGNSSTESRLPMAAPFTIMLAEHLIYCLKSEPVGTLIS